MAGAPVFSLGDEPSLFKDMDMLHHRGQGHTVRPGELGDGCLAQHQGGEDGAAGGISEGAERSIERCGILNHMV